MKNNQITVAIDASRNRSGGARNHLIGILTDGDPVRSGVKTVHVWSYRALLEELPNREWLKKHNPPELEKSLAHQVWWQMSVLPQALKRCECDILLNTDAGTFSNIRPCVTMSRDMLSYEPGEIRRYRYGKAWIRLVLLKYIQNRSLRRANGVIFLTRYAANAIQLSCGNLKSFAIIPHGVGKAFSMTRRLIAWPDASQRPIRCVYVSNTAPYKHQEHVVRGIEKMVKQGIDITLALVGGGGGNAQKQLIKQINTSDPFRQFIFEFGYISNTDLPQLLSEHDIFIFASSCENMPNTLLEAMASEIPIACSNRGPMPEILKDGGVYFDPENPEEIVNALKKIIYQSDLRYKNAARAKEIASCYSWSRCAQETFSYLTEVAKSSRQ